MQEMSLICAVACVHNECEFARWVRYSLAPTNVMADVVITTTNTACCVVIVTVASLNGVGYGYQYLGTGYCQSHVWSLPPATRAPRNGTTVEP